MPQNGEKQVDKSEYLFCNEKFLSKSKKKFLFSDRIRKRMIYLEKSKLKKNSKVLVYFLFNNNISKIDDLSKSPLPHKNLNEPVFVLFSLLNSFRTWCSKLFQRRFIFLLYIIKC